MKNIILFNITNSDRFALYNKFFEKVGFNCLGMCSDIKDFNYKDYNKIDIQDLVNIDFDLIFAHNNQIAHLREIMAKLNLPLSKTRILYYDFNNVQKIVGYDNVKYLFYDTYDIKNDKLVHDLKNVNFCGRIVDNKTSLTENCREQICDKILNSYIKQTKDLASEPEAYQPGENWSNYMKTTRPEFYNAIKNNDKKGLFQLITNFYRNCMSTGIYGGKEAFDIFKNSDALFYVFMDCFKVWLSRNNIKKVPIEELAMSPEGGAYGYNIENNIVSLNSLFFHTRANMCKNILDDKKSIVAEIGGGTGLLGFYLMKVSSNITYIDFDLPDNLISASYYIQASYPNKKTLVYDEKMQLTREKMLEYDIILMPHYMIHYLEDNSVDMFVNTISFGEMAYANIVEYYAQIERCARKYFYQENLFAPQGDYESYPINVYPELKTLKQVYSIPSPWTGVFDSTNKNHMYLEQLYKKVDKF